MNNLKLQRVAIGYAHSGKNVGGVRRYIENIENLSKHQTTLYPSYENDTLWREKYDMQVRNDYRNNEIIAKQQEIIDNHDVFHSNVDPTWIKLCAEAQKQGKLWIHTYHNIYMAEDEPDGKLKDWQQEINDAQFNVASKADYKLCVGEWLVDECKKRNIDSDFVPNFIPIDKLSTIKKNNFKNKYHLSEFILFSGDVSVRKNGVEFIKTARLLPQYKFVLMGTGLTKEEIVKSHNIELTDNIIALGPLSHTECLEAMNDCSILVMNSFTEGLPTVLIEAMYYETPCIIPDGPDWSKYLLKDNKIGYKYPLGNVEKLAEKICEIMKDYKELPLAKKYVEDTFSSNAVISKLDDLYNNTKINITILTDCHGQNIHYCLIKMLDNTKCNITFVSLLPYVVEDVKIIKKTDYDIKDKNMISYADILIYQIIEKDRKFLNNNNTLNLCKKGCIKIGIPHYRCNIYVSPEFWDFPFYDLYNGKFNSNYDNPISTIKNILIDACSKTDVKRFKRNIDDSLSKFQKIDNLSDIKMFNYFVNNYKNIKLFMGCSYPSSIFFFELTKRIVNYLNIKGTFKYEDRSIYTNTNIPVSVSYYKFADFKFKNEKFIVHGEYLTETEYWTNLLIMAPIQNCLNSNLFLKKLKETKMLLMGTNTSNNLNHNSYNIEYLKTDLLNIILNKQIHYNYNGIDFMYNNKKNKKLLILFHGAVKLNVKKPVFYGYNIVPNDYDVLSFSCPLFTKYKNLELSWFLSSKSCNTFEMIKEIIENIKFKYTNILCHGSSAGGFPSLLISSYFNFDCIINNSQLYLSKYYYYKILKNIVSDIIDIDIEKYIKENGLPRNLYLYQNINDEEHYARYTEFKLFLKSNFDCSNVYFNEFIREDIGKAIPWYPDVEQYKMDRPKTVNWNVDIDEKKYNKYYQLRRDTLGKNHNSPFPEGVCKFQIFSDILNNKEIDSYKECDFKKNLLISSLDNKFFVEIVEKLKQDYNVKIDMFHENKEGKREELLNWTDIIFCEWCEVNALWYSQNKKSHQKLFIRLHKYELVTSFFYDINWKNVNNLIFIAPEIKRLSNKHILQKKYVNKDNFNWEFYLNNNNDLFEELDKKNYNKNWAWNHWINYGNKMNWRRPVIKLNDNIDYNVICDEFKHFNGGELIWNYVKSDMFTDLPKLEGSEFNIGIVGILPKIKRPDIAVDIIENLIKKDKRYKLFILGKHFTEWQGTSNNKNEIDYYKKLEERINKKEIKNHIVVDKFTPEVHKWFQKIGFILSVSDIEGCHQSVAEAMATGTIPLIYGKALKEYKLDEVYPKKYCFYEDTVDKLCDKIQFYSNNKEEKYVIIGECKKYSNNNFKLNKIFSKYKDLINE